MIAIHNHRQKSISYNSTQVPPQIDSLIEYFDSTWINGQFQISSGIVSISVAHAPTTTLKVVHSGAKEPSRRRKIRERERRIETLFQRFNGGTVSIDEYLDSFKNHTIL